MTCFLGWSIRRLEHGLRRIPTHVIDYSFRLVLLEKQIIVVLVYLLVLLRVVWVVVRYRLGHLVEESICGFKLLCLLWEGLCPNYSTIDMVWNSVAKTSKIFCLVFTYLHQTLVSANGFRNVIELLCNSVHKIWFTQVIDVVIILWFSSSIPERVMGVYRSCLALFPLLATNSI